MAVWRHVGVRCAIRLGGTVVGFAVVKSPTSMCKCLAEACSAGVELVFNVVGLVSGGAILGTGDIVHERVKREVVLQLCDWVGRVVEGLLFVAFSLGGVPLVDVDVIRVVELPGTQREPHLRPLICESVDPVIGTFHAKR